MQTTQPTRRVVARRPAPRTTQDAREVELAQLQRRFRASFMILEKTEEAMSVKIKIPPSDPDFPYELEALSLHIRIPAEYPAAKCSIQVTNPEISRGFARNLEKGFEQHQAAQPNHRTLVQEMAWLDNNMEILLQEPPAPTIRFVSNTAPKEPPATIEPPAVTKTSPPATPKHYALEQIQEAKVKREAEIRKLKAQFRNELSDISRDSMTTVLLIKLPLDANCLFKEELGGTINIEMEIPAHYPMDPCRIKIVNAHNLPAWRAQSVEQGFANRSLASPATLFQQLNWLNTNLNALLDVPAPTRTSVIHKQESTTNTSPPIAHPVQSSEVHQDLNDRFRKDKKVYVEKPLDPVPKDETPPLKVGDDDQEHSSEETSRSQQESDDDEISIKLGSTSISTTPQQVRSGTEIRFPDLRLENVALLRCARMFLMVKCNRCTNTVEIENIIPEQAAVDSASNGSEKYQRWLPCPTCSSLIGALFKGNYLHANSITLGLLQLASCTPFDLLPSTYIATCTNCMEPHIPIKLTVHDQPKSTVCRNCHSKMSIGIPNSQFVRLGSGTGSKELRADPNAVLQLKKKKQPKQDLGLVVGQPLPHQGACEHYRKSRRWFRFSCCNRIHPCDRCHDDKEDHKAELAKMHICGFCSREFTSSKSICACGQEPGKYHTGTFWEGGEGTRNKRIMSRKDKHKYSGSPFKTTSKKQQRVGEAGKKATQNKVKQDTAKSI